VGRETGVASATRVSRRSFLRGLGAVGGTFILGTPPARGQAAGPRLGSSLFTLGVASGDPAPDSVVLWTRLAPKPLDEGGGMPPDPVTVRWEVADDQQFSRVIASGTVDVVAADAHTVHVEVRGLESDRGYWYRFRAGNEVSRTGHTRTMPGRGAPVDCLCIAIASCQHHEVGYFGAYRRMIEDGARLIVHLGDYIYENRSREKVIRRAHKIVQPRSLDEYRRHHALYRTDADLQEAHAMVPWAPIWDDHDVENDYAGDASPTLESNEFLARRAAAYRAYWEHLPLRPAALPRGSSMTIHRQLVFGDLLELSLLDERQYRSRQACALPKSWGRLLDGCDERLDGKRTMLGTDQENWVIGHVGRAGARWTAVAQGVMFAPLLQGSPGTPQHWSDGWDGYPAARQKMLEHLAAPTVSNPVVLSGDIHSFWVNDLVREGGGANPIGTEFVTTSITSPLGRHADEGFRKAKDRNPHVRAYEGDHRGYVLATVTRDRWRVDLRGVDCSSGTQRASTVTSYATHAGRPGGVKV